MTAAAMSPRRAVVVQEAGTEYKGDYYERRRRYKHAVPFLDSDIVRLGDSRLSG